MQAVEKRLERHPALPKYDILINPAPRIHVRGKKRIVYEAGARRPDDALEHRRMVRRHGVFGQTQSFAFAMALLLVWDSCRACASRRSSP